MDISRAAVGVLAAVCVTAGAAVAYLARPSTPVPAAEQAFATESLGVEQSEATVGEVAMPLATAIPEQPVASPRAARVHAPAARRAEPRATAVESTRARPAEPIEQRAEYVPDTRAAAAPVVELPRAPEVEPTPPAALFEELVVSADSVIGLQVESALTSERAQVEDEVVAQVTRDVKVGDRVAVPAGSRAYGEVTMVERGGRMKDRAKLGVRFTSIVLGDGTRVPIETETIVREGSSPSGESAAKIGGGAIGGAIIGGILGGAKGAMIGGSVGAGAGTGAVLASGRNAATLASGTPVTVRLLRPTTVTIEK